MKTTRVTGGLVAMGLMLWFQAAQMQEKPFVRATEAQVMAALKTAGESAKGNYQSLESAFQREIRKIWNDYDNKAQPVYERVELLVNIMGPAELVVNIAVSNLRRGEPIGSISWPGGVTVYVSALTSESPDITDIIVERNGKVVAPLSKGLVAKTVDSGQGGRQGPQRTVHEGGFVYPIEAFDPGTEVTVTAVSDSGRKLSRTIVDRELRKLQ